MSDAPTYVPPPPDAIRMSSAELVPADTDAREAGTYITHGPALACACGSTALLAIQPGTDDDVLMGFVLKRGERVQCWCEACWERRFGYDGAVVEGNR